MTSAIQSVPIQTAQALREPIIYMAKNVQCTTIPHGIELRLQIVVVNIISRYSLYSEKSCTRVKEEDDEDDSGGG